MSFESLVRSQYNLGDQIESLARNFAKDPKDRKTSNYYAKRLENLQNWGTQFHNNHEAIMTLVDKPKDDEYFTQNYYQRIQAIVVRHTQLFERNSMELINVEDGAKATTKGQNAQERTSLNERDNLSYETRKTLRNQRALIKALTQNIDEIFSQQHIDHPSSYYTIKATIIEKHMVDLATNNTALWNSTDQEQIDDYTPQTYYDIEGRAESAMIELQRHMNLEQNNHLLRATAPTVMDIPLPRITLPKFDGSYMRWVEFSDLYTELVHNAAISDGKKMHYLTSSLEGEPKNLIKHLPAVGSNYAVAWSILTSRYDNKRLLVTTLLNKLMTQPSMKRESASSMKSLHDVTKECIHGLKAQGIPVQHWDVILVHIVLRKMDEETQTMFEQGLTDNRRLVNIDEVLRFLERRFQSFEARGKGDRLPTRTCASVTTSGSNETCKICNREAHRIYACKTFTNAELSQRWKWVKDLKLCVNCLRTGHRSNECKSRHCSKCTKNHNTLLHNPAATQINTKSTLSSEKKSSYQLSAPSKDAGQPEQSSNKVSLLTNHRNKDSNYVLLGTARITVMAANGQRIDCRAILDSGSQVNLITERLLKRLGGKTKQFSMHVEGIGANETTMRHQTSIRFQSTLNDFTAEINTHILPKIVSDQPVHLLNVESWGIPQDIRLADPDFNKPGRIDCLLGAEVFYELLTNGQIKLADNLPVLQNSVLGWVIAGNMERSSSTNAVCGICTTKELEEAISRFWEYEEIPDSNVQLTEDELHCESHFLQHIARAKDGKFIVKLPLKTHPSVLAESKGMAYERFKSIERRLTNNPTLKDQYVSFMREYESLGHMTQINADGLRTPCYFIPHHCVLRPDKSTTKLRVVFDASARKSSGPSLNDIMFTGPTVQSELFSILLRFRMHKYVLKTDVEKMYRQIWINNEDRNLQLIFWRENHNQPLKVYQLNTVTYGTRAAPYLATRCLVQLADEHQGQHPYGASSLRKDFYVDDGLIGADTIYEALMVQQQLITILAGAGMKLKKWCSNSPQLLHDIAAEDQEVNLNFESKETQATKTLGLLWLPKSDVFCIKANIREREHITKRTMSSDLAHIYDPLGLIGPVLVTGKIQLQRTWQLKLDWDDDLPTEIQNQWTSYREALSALDNVTFPRHVFSNQGYTNIEIHAFADASERAYGAAVYVRVIKKDKTINVNLLCSKSRVAPTKLQTIPRLELCAALLAAELLARVKLDLNYQDKASYCWTDSQIVLSWIHNHPGTLPVYVAHRIVKILHLTIPDQWRHVPSKQNPADILSRGLKPREFSSCNMWWYGPLFLYQQKALWPAPFKRESIIDENNAVIMLTTKQVQDEHPWIYAIHSKNSFSHVQRIVGYVLRFIKNTRQPRESRPEHRQLSPMELDTSLKLIVRQIQTSDFLDLKKTLIKDKFVPKTNHLSSLTPFLDEENVIRVGGRLNASGQPFDATHPMILPGNDPLVKLLVERIHQENYHCGPQALLAQVRQRFWPLKGKSLARSVVQRCVRCTKAKPIMYTQIMGNLPEMRVQAARPFLNAGVDYCGPFWVHFKVRGKRPQKCYIAVFVCFATKAVHLELVTDLTTDAFIGCLKRFIARRGHCKTLHCDNATNFVGARNQLQELQDVIHSPHAKESIITACSAKGMEFQFIPPRSPHFGGLWEAAVKSAKQLMLKNVSTASLTYEELETVIVEIEAILNSRPLVPCSSDANDFNALTPSHFLIGEALTSSVDVHAKPTNLKLLERWQLVSQLKQTFWQRWSTEYLSELQHKHKWKGPMTIIKPNTLVIIKEDNTPVLQWPLGRIVKSHTGEDGIVRVCEVKTQKGVFKRPVHRLAPLFPEETEAQQLESAKMQNAQSASLMVKVPLHRINGNFLNPDSHPQKRRRLSSGLLVTMLTLLFLPLAMSTPINVTQFDNKPGIYFEKINKIKFATATWNMVVYFDLSPLQQEVETLNDGISTLAKLCDNSSEDSQCKFFLQHFDKTKDDLQAKVNLLSGKRSKRGAMDIVGNLANSLFGVLDGNYAKEMSETINNLRKRDDHLLLLLKNQTSLIDSTVNIIKENQLATQTKFDEIDNRINDLLYGGKPLNELQVSQNVLTLSVQMFMMASNLLWTHSSILDVLIDSRHGKINPLLITPHQLHEEVLKIKAHLPSNLQLPIHQDNILEVYKLINVKGIVAHSHVVFTIELPLADPREFDLLYLVPIAAAINGSLSATRTSTSFLAISPHRNEFLPMSQHQIDSCLSLSDDELLCPNKQTVYHAESTVNKCEIDLFNNQVNPRCTFATLDETTLWYPLLRSNHWVYATLNSMRLNAVCNEDSYSFNIEKSGLIQIRADCIVRSDLLTIQGHANMISSIKTPTSKVNTPLGWNKQYANNNISIKSFKPNIPDLEAIQRKLLQLNTSTLQDQVLTTNKHSLVISYTSISLIVIITFIVTYQIKKMKHDQPAPAARPRYSIEDTVC